PPSSRLKPGEGEGAPLRVAHLRTGSLNLTLRGVSPVVPVRALAEFRPSSSTPMIPVTQDGPRAETFRQEIATRSAANLIPTALRAAGAWAGMRQVPDSPADVAFHARTNAPQPRLSLPCEATA